jgi:hypothetical protein
MANTANSDQEFVWDPRTGTPGLLEELVQSMPSGMEAVILANGKLTKSFSICTVYIRAGVLILVICKLQVRSHTSYSLSECFDPSNEGWCFDSSSKQKKTKILPNLFKSSDRLA